MFRLRRWYNQNSKTIWKITGIVVFLILVLRVLNYFAGQNNTIEYSNINSEIVTQQQYTDLSISTDKSVLSNEKISSSQKSSIQTINSFFAYCNEGNIKKAYELLTDECKEEMYPKEKDFKNNYYDQVFKGKKKEISVENWTGDIYQVFIEDDFLSTGIYNEGNTKRGYITIESVEDGEYKLNINGYIGRKNINKSVDYNNINLEVLRKDSYMDYEIYTFKIINNTENPILLDNLLNIDSMYIQDKNGIKYYAYTHEIALSELLLNKEETREISIKYYNKFTSKKQIEKMVFSGLIIDYNAYKNIQDKSLFKDYVEIKIDL